MKPGIAGALLAVIASAAVYAAIPGATEAARGNGGAPAVCGSVVTAQEAVQMRGEPVLLTLRRAYADQDVTVVLLGEARSRFGLPDTLIGRRLCVSGHVQSFLGRPRMVLDSATE